jgi:hypothetical protein
VFRKAVCVSDDIEYLWRPLPVFSLRRCRFAALKVFLKTVGRLSQGIRTGLAQGFDSGHSLDYVYENKPRGLTPLGRLIDRAYLNSLGWRRIRDRKRNLHALLEKAAEALSKAGRPIRLLDIAAGPGRYVLEAAAKSGHPIEAIMLRDIDTESLDDGRIIAKRMGFHQAIFEQGDAFDTDELAAVRPRPTAAVVSGLYEQILDNDPVQASLRGLSLAIEDGGYIIYTNQPRHPQLELVARVLINRKGQPWIMRCRPQAELDALVHAAGFEKEDVLTDEDGIFTVSLARRQPRTG